MKTLDELIRTYGGGPGMTEEVWLPASQVRQVVADRERSAAAKALRAFADAHRMPWTIFRRTDDSPVTVGDLLRETADRIERGE